MRIKRISRKICLFLIGFNLLIPIHYLYQISGDMLFFIKLSSIITTISTILGSSYLLIISPKFLLTRFNKLFVIILNFVTFFYYILLIFLRNFKIIFIFLTCFSFIIGLNESFSIIIDPINIPFLLLGISFSSFFSSFLHFLSFNSSVTVTGPTKSTTTNTSNTNTSVTNSTTNTSTTTTTNPTTTTTNPTTTTTTTGSIITNEPIKSASVVPTAATPAATPTTTPTIGTSGSLRPKRIGHMGFGGPVGPGGPVGLGGPGGPGGPVGPIPVTGILIAGLIISIIIIIMCIYVYGGSGLFNIIGIKVKDFILDNSEKKLSEENEEYEKYLNDKIQHKIKNLEYEIILKPNLTQDYNIKNIINLKKIKKHKCNFFSYSRYGDWSHRNYTCTWYHKY